MAIYRLQCVIGADSPNIRDRFVITPHFSVPAVADEQSLTDDLSTALAAYFSGGREVRVTAYDAQGTPPVYPVGDTTRNVGTYPISDTVRELALCLSFYSGANRPRRRGRLYVPLAAIGMTPSGVRPTSTPQNKVGALAPILANLGGVDVDWCVYSRADDQGYPVSNWYVDDEWDIVRTRGLRPTTRITGTTSE